ncbi:TylF/MycF/NovP-related O-methyltransferase [Lacinutrix iliipiscaria]|uniref:TylF/MycF/NovP-related O-methyltransferase n=1 Tax=Lacinutrix iliipiscaria TaxID=1230532 RepID=A0ABW5WPU3_9FLAO
MKKVKKQLSKILSLSQAEKLNKNNEVEQNTADFSDFEKEIIKKTNNFTMTSSERIVSLIRATEYVIKNNIEGSIVECGVWKGGSIMAVLHTLNQLKKEKDVFLYDTFEGMTYPTDEDFSVKKQQSAKEIYVDKNGVMCYSSLEEVQSNIQSVDYNKDHIHFIKGKVEDTIPDHNTPEKIALLRLDTDWYESTKHEMEHLFPRLEKGGIIIIDDYGHWSGCKKAVDEYLDKNNIPLFLSRIDYTCRIGVKM